VKAALARIEEAVGLKFGDPSRPLLVSVRSGARVSMPGMMDTVLNLGLNDTTVEGLAAASGDARFAWDSYRRFIQMFGSVVLGIDHHRFEEIIEEAKLAAGAPRTPRSPRRLARRGATATRRWWRRCAASPSRRTRRRSSGARSAPCSAPG
jgi:phosphoenolpyruvate synthase/pyruvate phosphate dikinase